MRSFPQCRRGSVAVATVIALVPLIGFIALGAEAGSWYVTRQHAQNAADAAAYSGGLRLACLLSGSSTCEVATSPPDYVYRGKQFADRNGFCDTRDTSYACNSTPPAGTTHTVQIDRGTYTSGAWTTSASGNFIRASASQQQSGYLAAVLGFTTINIGAQAIVEVKNPKNLCGLGLGPSAPALTIGSGSSITGSGCGLMSDTSVKFNGGPSFTGPDWAVNAVNGCVASAGHCALSVPYNYNALPATNPLKVLDTESFNSRTGNTSPLNSVSPCVPPQGITATKCYSVTPNSSGSGAYKEFSVSTNDWVDFTPGTYFFYNATIKITGGTVTCSTCTGTGTSGVTLVLLGTTSSLTINGASVNLTAPVTNSYSSDLNGVLIDDQAQNSVSSKVAVNISGGGNVSLGGAMYFPYADVTYGGTVQSTFTNCSEVVASTLTISGNSTYLSTTNCAANTVIKTQVVALVN